MQESKSLKRKASLTRRGVLLAGAMALAASVAACGRKGALEPPAGAWSPPDDKPGTKPPRDHVKPREPFVLDPLLN